MMDELLPDHRVIEQVAVGSLNDPGVLELILGVHSLQRESGIDDTLLDCRALSQSAAPINLIGLADRVATLGLQPGWRQAIVTPEDPWAAMTVMRWEAVATNRGMTVRLFHDRESALAWLTGSTPDGADGS